MIQQRITVLPSMVVLLLSFLIASPVTNGFVQVSPATQQSIRIHHGFSRRRNTLSLLQSSNDDKNTMAVDESSSGSSMMGDPTSVVMPLETTSDNEVYRQAIQRTLLWVALASAFGGGLWYFAGSEIGEEFFAGYLVEQSLSVDNLFVFLLLFDYFKIPLQSQDKILNWGIYGAIVMRAVMIGVGAAALENFHAILLVFAGILVYSSGKILVDAMDDGDDDEEDMSNDAIVQFAGKLIDSTDQFDGDKFFTIIDGIKYATPLFICMIAIEISDVVFAVDSIPAVFGVTENPLIVFSSNMFAIMGLRSLYTILSKAATDLKYLEPAVAVVLGFIGCKMIAEYFGYIIPTAIALAVVAFFLGTGIGVSVLEKQNESENSPSS